MVRPDATDRCGARQVGDRGGDRSDAFGLDVGSVGGAGALVRSGQHQRHQRDNDAGTVTVQAVSEVEGNWNESIVLECEFKTLDDKLYVQGECCWFC